MSEEIHYPDFVNCGFCGDRYRYDAAHECWAYERVQQQEDLPATCPICFGAILAPHWRCTDDEQTTHPVIG